MSPLQPFPIDITLFHLTNIQWRNPLFDTIMPPISSIAIMGLILLIPVLILVARQGKKQLVAVFFILLMMGCADYNANFIKDYFGKVRPYQSQPLAWHIDNGEWAQRPADFVQEKQHGNSFPSSHAANTMVLAVLAMCFWKQSRKWIWIIPIVVGYSRLYLGKHYISDVLGGYCWGIIVATMGWIIWKKLIVPRLPDKWNPQSV